MTPHLAAHPLLLAVRASPGEDGPRLAFADWLDANGNSEWAAFIRVQCELSQVANHFNHPHRDCRGLWLRLRSRLRAAAPPVLAQYGAGSYFDGRDRNGRPPFVRPDEYVGELAGGVVAIWRRGFVSELRGLGSELLYKSPLLTWPVGQVCLTGFLPDCLAEVRGGWRRVGRLGDDPATVRDTNWSWAWYEHWPRTGSTAWRGEESRSPSLPRRIFDRLVGGESVPDEVFGLRGVPFATVGRMYSTWDDAIGAMAAATNDWWASRPHPLTPVIPS